MVKSQLNQKQKTKKQETKKLKKKKKETDIKNYGELYKIASSYLW